MIDIRKNFLPVALINDIKKDIFYIFQRILVNLNGIPI